MTTSGIPYVEVYRPKIIEDIVLDPLNKQILKNIIDTCYFPNLLYNVSHIFLSIMCIFL